MYTATQVKATYAWLITKDCFTNDPQDPTTCLGVMGPGSTDMTREDIKKHRDGVPFRMLDDDGDVNYYGIFVGDANSEDAFGPLDDYGQPGLGCTEIQYKRNGQWETL